MAEKVNKPQIRFEGFTDAWEQRKLGEVANLLTGFPFESKKFVREGIKLVRGMNVKRGYLDFSEELCEYWSSSQGLENYLLNSGDILIQMDGALIGKSYAKIKENQLPALLVQRVTRVRIQNQIADESFVYQQIQKGFLTYIKGTKTETAVPHLSLNDIESFEIATPSVDEEKKIGAFFESLDHLITLHQRKYDKLQILKKAMLEKMFPKNGSSVPEIRFKGYTDAWEQRKLGEVADIYDGVHQTPIYTDSGIMFLSVENIGTLKSNKYISEEAFNRDYKVYPQKGDILMTRIGDVGTPNVVETSERIAFYVSLALLKPRNVESYFLCNSILSPFFQSGLKERTLITAIPKKINKDEIGNVSLFLPHSTNEQMQIGGFFKQLNALITLHQQKLDTLKRLKKAMLGKMFV